MNPDEPPNVTSDPIAGSVEDTAGQPPDPDGQSADSPTREWQLWPPSPKMQIVLIAIGFGLFNLILLGIWAAVMVYRFN